MINLSSLGIKSFITVTVTVSYQVSMNLIQPWTESNTQMGNFTSQATGKRFFYKFYELEIYPGALSP